MSKIKKHGTKLLLGIILIMALVMTNFTQPVKAANPGTTSVWIDGQLLDSTNKYLINGVKSPTGSLGSDGCTASFTSDTGDLYLYNYIGDRIYVDGSIAADLKVILQGNNTITTASSAGIYNRNGGNISVTSVSDSSLLINIVNEVNEDGAYGITGNYGSHPVPADINIGGKVNININVTTTSVTNSYGIFSTEDINILDDASITITNNGFQGYCIFAGNNININTNKNITLNIETTNISYPTNNKATLQKANILSTRVLTPREANINPNYDNTAFVVNGPYIDGAYSYKTFRNGTPRLLKINDGFITKFKNIDQNNNQGSYLSGDSMTIQLDESKIPVNYKFKEWQGTAGLTFTDSTSKTSPTAKFTMPANNVELTATYEQTLFTVQPTGGTAQVGQNIYFNWTINSFTGNVDYAQVQKKVDGIWEYYYVLGDSYENPGDYQDYLIKTVPFSETYRIYYRIFPDDFYSDEFTLTWTNDPAVVSDVTITPTTVDVHKGTTQDFTATVNGTGSYNNTVSWSLAGGVAGTTISNAGQLYIAPNETASTLTVTATSVGDPTKSATATVNVLPLKSLAGYIQINGITKFGQTLTVGGANVVNNTGTLTYKWYRGDSIVIGSDIATGTTYTTTEEDIGKIIRCRVTSSIQTGNLDASTFAITKADGPSGPSGITTLRPTTVGGSDGKILGTTSLMEYADNVSLSGAKSCQDGETTGLTVGTYYVMYKATSTHERSLPTTVTILDMETLTGTVNIDGTRAYGNTLTASVSGSNNTGTLAYSWYRGADKVGTTNTYLLTTGDIGIDLECVVISTEQGGNIRSFSGTIGKATAPSAPTGLTPVKPTTLGGSDGKIVGTTTLMEYADNNMFTGAKPCMAGETTGLIAGTYYVRLKETSTQDASNYATVTIQAANALTGTVVITGIPKYGNTLTASVSGGNNTGTLTYSWYRGASVVVTGSTYLIKTEDIGLDLRCEAYSSIEVDSISGNSGTILKANGPAAPTGLTPVSPTTIDGADGKITGTTILMEYATNNAFTGAQDCMASETTGLVAGTYYIRVKATDTHESGTYTTITIAELEALNGTVVITGVKKFGNLLTATVTGSNNTGTLTYKWYRGTIEIATGSTYTIKAEDIGTNLSCIVTSSIQPESITGSLGPITKADGSNAPTGLSPVSPTTVGGTNGVINGTSSLMEYATNTSFTDAKECNNLKTDSLKAGTYFIRVKATSTQEAGNYIAIIVQDGKPAVVIKPVVVTKPVISTNTNPNGDVSNNQTTTTTTDDNTPTIEEQKPSVDEEKPSVDDKDQVKKDDTNIEKDSNKAIYLLLAIPLVSIPVLIYLFYIKK